MFHLLIQHPDYIESQPIAAGDLASAADQIRQIIGTGLAGDGSTPIQLALLVPDAVATVTPGNPATIDTTFSTMVQNRSALLSKAGNAVSSNQTFLGLGSPTAAQTLAQVQSLTRQVNALIRLATQMLDSTNGT